MTSLKIEDLIFDTASMFGVKSVTQGFKFDQERMSSLAVFTVEDCISILTEPKISQMLAGFLNPFGNDDLQRILVRVVSIRLYDMLYEILILGNSFKPQEDAVKLIETAVALGLSDVLQKMLPLSPQ